MPHFAEALRREEARGFAALAPSSTHAKPVGEEDLRASCSSIARGPSRMPIGGSSARSASAPCLRRACKPFFILRFELGVLHL